MAPWTRPAAAALLVAALLAPGARALAGSDDPADGDGDEPAGPDDGDHIGRAGNAGDTGGRAGPGGAAADPGGDRVEALERTVRELQERLSQESARLEALERPPPPRRDGPRLALHGYAKGLGDVRLSTPYPFTPTARLQADVSGGYGVADFRAMVDLDLSLADVPAADLGDRAAEVTLIPVELRVNAHPGPLDLSAGKQYVLWGQTDWINPTDLFTPWDYVHISSELEDYRIAPWALRATAYVRATSLDLVWAPLPQPHVMDLSAAEEEGVEVADPVLPDRDVRHGDVGLRVATRLGSLDASAMGFYGMDKRPGMAMDAVVDTAVMPPDVTLVLTPTHGMMGAVGGDLAWGAGPILLKGEAAYYWTEDRDGDDPTVRNQELLAVVGLTAVPATWLDVTIQGAVSRLGRYDPDEEVAALEALGMPDPQADPRTSGSLVERLSVSIGDVVSIRAVGLQNLPDGDHMVLAFVSWRAADGLTVLGGALVFGGPDGTDLGRAADASRVFAEVKYSF